MARSSPWLAACVVLVALASAERHEDARAGAVPVGGQPLTEAARWLQGYLRIDTTNPPGNEAPAAAYLAEILHREGIATRRLVTPDGRTNLYAHLEAPQPEAGALLLLHHMDVVPVGKGWTVDPFSGRLENGRLWGRGAIDAKSLGIAQLAAFVDLHRAGGPLSRNVILLAVADEETGGERGTAWLLEHHPELFSEVAAVLNEGGANRVVGERLLWWGVEVAQKRPLWMRVTARGRGGHGSGLNPDSAMHQLLEGLVEMLALPQRYRVTEAAHLYFGALAPFHGETFRRVFGQEDLPRVQKEVDALAETGRLSDLLLPGMPVFFLDTVQVTSVDGGASAINVVPDEASAQVDIRLLPDTDSAAFLEEVGEALGERLETEILLDSPPTSPSPLGTPIYRDLEEALSTRAPVVPAFIAGTTDSRYFRERGIPAYGFSPFALNGEEARGIHGADESIPLAKFQRGVEVMRRAVFASARGSASD